MLYALLIISLVFFYICGYRIMARLDRFLGTNRAVESKKNGCSYFDKFRLVWVQTKRRLFRSVKDNVSPTNRKIRSGEILIR